MTLILDTRRIPVADRISVVRETVAATMVDVRIDFPTETAPAAAYCAITKLGELTICSARSNAGALNRTPILARDGMRPTIFLGLQIDGTSLVVQDGRELVLRPGDLAFSESTSPYTLVYGDGIREHFFCIPFDALALPHEMIRRLSAVRLSPGHPLADLTATYLRRLGARPEHVTHPSAQEVAPPTIELIRALLTTHLDTAELANGSVDATLSLRVLEYLRAHLGDPDLGAAQVAGAHHISVRHLYNVLARDGISLGDWIRTQRLERCRAELSRPATRGVTISSIAQRWGFRDVSHFGRLFRASYGCTPREWREIARHQHP